MGTMQLHTLRKRPVIEYLGKISGRGRLICNGREIFPADYEFEGYLDHTRLISSGEIRLSETALKGVFGRSDVQLITSDGRQLRLRFSERILPAHSLAAHVDVIGDVPRDREFWRL